MVEIQTEDESIQKMRLFCLHWTTIQHLQPSQIQFQWYKIIPSTTNCTISSHQDGLRVFLGALIHGVPAMANLHKAFTCSGKAYSIPTRGPTRMFSGSGASRSSKPPETHSYINPTTKFFNRLTGRSCIMTVTRSVKWMVRPFCW